MSEQGRKAVRCGNSEARDKNAGWEEGSTHILEGVSEKDTTMDRIMAVIEEGIQGATEAGWDSFGIRRQ